MQQGNKKQYVESFPPLIENLSVRKEGILDAMFVMFATPQIRGEFVSAFRFIQTQVLELLGYHVPGLLQGLHAV